ncbi:MAG: hypothetical protein LBH44_07360 [Treponema sp.]|jgi:hypothetical protein|nr:hypothetical protein [Treponema sp.]
MQTITCDVCRKKVDNPITGRSFYYVAEHDICESCNDALDYLIRPNIRNKDPFSYEWYTKFVQDSLTKAVQKGKV